MHDSNFDPYSTDMLQLIEAQKRDAVRGILWLGGAVICAIIVGTLIAMTTLSLWR